MKIKIKALSVNKCWQGRRFKTKEYDVYIEEMLWLLKGYKGYRPKDKEHFGLIIKWGSPGANRADIDNILKPFLDSLVKSGIITDDRYCYELHIQKVKSDHNYIDFKILGITLLTPIQK